MPSTVSTVGLSLTVTSGTYRWTFHVEKNHDRHMSKRLPMFQLSHIFPQCFCSFQGTLASNPITLLLTMHLVPIVSSTHFNLNHGRVYGFVSLKTMIWGAWQCSLCAVGFFSPHCKKALQNKKKSYKMGETMLKSANRTGTIIKASFSVEGIFN